MGSTNGFLDFDRKDFIYKAVEKRVGNFEEIITFNSDLVIKKQAARCMECELPFCHILGCPMNNRIPEWLDLVFSGNLKEAYDSLISINPLPEITGRICPAICEASCTLSINMAPVTIKQIELYIIEKAFESGHIKTDQPKAKKNKSVAIIGSGPAGLSASIELAKNGYNVTIYEMADSVGGILRYGIPNFKLPKRVLDRRIDILKNEGIEFITGVEIGRDIQIEFLYENFDAVLLCIGARKPRDLSVFGRQSVGIHFALDYLTNATQHLYGEIDDNELISAKNKRVLIIGGGDTGSDCIGTAIRQGAKAITQIEIMPKPISWYESYNPNWPKYPNIFRTSTSQQEGCTRLFGIDTVSFTSDNNLVSGAICRRVEWTDDLQGKRVMAAIENSEFHLDADMILISMGFLHPEHSNWLEKLGVEYDQQGIIKAEGHHTTVKGVFAAGDAQTGASLVCRAINSGKQAAIAIDNYLESFIESSPQ